MMKGHCFEIYFIGLGGFGRHVNMKETILPHLQGIGRALFEIRFKVLMEAKH